MPRYWRQSARSKLPGRQLKMDGPSSSGRISITAMRRAALSTALNDISLCCVMLPKPNSQVLVWTQVSKMENTNRQGAKLVQNVRCVFCASLSSLSQLAGSADAILLADSMTGSAMAAITFQPGNDLPPRAILPMLLPDPVWGAWHGVIPHDALHLYRPPVLWAKPSMKCIFRRQVRPVAATAAISPAHAGATIPPARANSRLESGQHRRS